MTTDHSFFLDRGAAWGNQNKGVAKTGLEKTACTMLIGLRLLHYLGAKTVFLLGVDFIMKRTVGMVGNYAFGEDRDENAIESNNEHYRIAGGWLQSLKPVFEQFGFRVYNCNRESGLRAFEHVPFDDAMEVCRGGVPSEEFDLNGWYSKETKG